MNPNLNANDSTPPKVLEDPFLIGLKAELIALRDFIHLNTLSPEIKAYKQGELTMLSSLIIRIRDRL